MDDLQLGVIGNCTVAALLDPRGSIVWACFPRFDGDPAFYRLVNGVSGDASAVSHEPAGSDPDDARYDGTFTIELEGETHHEQSYLTNSAVLRTVLRDDAGNAVEINDFAPRYTQGERIHRPSMLVRHVVPLSGRPHIRVRVRPRFEHGAMRPELTRGSNHIRYVGPSQSLRLTTDLPVSYVVEERSFLLNGPGTLIFGTDESPATGVEAIARDWFERTQTHWRGWVRSLSVPFEWQDVVIRAAITLKLCNFEETGAIVAALTTSIPEAPGSGRNWDYRYCWVRDAYFVIQALNRLGDTRTMEGYIGFVGDIVDEMGDSDLQPVFGVTRARDLDERVADALRGYRGFGPVRIGNQAYQQVQNDVYGSIVLASTHAFFDQRLVLADQDRLFAQLEAVGHRAALDYTNPDAGPWEIRHVTRPHTFSAVMCWAACDRLARIADHLGKKDRSLHWRQQADAMHAVISARTWNESMQSFVSTFDGNDIDATLLLLHELDFLADDDPRFVRTVEAVGTRLERGDFLYRYDSDDGFGRPETAFVICAFWYINALVTIGRKAEARALFERILTHRNPLGLLSEDIDPKTGELWGNFPQTYSMVGLINAAVRISVSWEDAF